MCNQLVSWATGHGDASASPHSLAIRYSLKTSSQMRYISDLWHLVLSKPIGQSVTTMVQVTPFQTALILLVMYLLISIQMFLHPLST